MTAVHSLSDHFRKALDPPGFRAFLFVAIYDMK